MKKLILCLFVLTVMTSSHEFVAGKNAISVNDATSSNVAKYIAYNYNLLDFKGKEKLSPLVFEKAFVGYLNLRNAGKLNTDKQILTIADFSQSSCKTRLWIINLQTHKVLLNDYVAHGQGSGDEFAKVFSNTENSHQSSLGFYVTGETYIGDHGRSLRLEGMDNGYNSAAMERAVVVHGADYVSKDFIKSQKRLGRSWGCPAVATKIADKVIDIIQDGTCLFIYYPDKKYMANSYWLNKKIDRLPEDNMKTDMLAFANQPNIKVVHIYEFSATELYIIKKYNLMSIHRLLP